MSESCSRAPGPLANWQTLLQPSTLIPGSVQVQQTPDTVWPPRSAVCCCAVLTPVLAMQSVQDEFISGVLAEEELGTKLHVHLAEGCYAARILNPRSYDAVSRCG